MAPCVSLDAAQYSTRRMVEMLKTLPPAYVAQALARVAPGTDPSALSYGEQARILGATGIAGLMGLSPHAVMMGAGGPELVSAAGLVDSNPELSNGYHAMRLAIVPANRCADRSMGDLFSTVSSAISAWGADGAPTTDETVAPQLSGDGWPASPAFRAGNWNFDDCTYMIAQGDTLSGLARLYLGRPNRWTEIHALNPQFKADASSTQGRAFQEGDTFQMPAEACARAAQMVSDGQQSAPPTGGAPGTIPGESKDGLHTSAPLSDNTKTKIAIGVVGGLAVLGIGWAIASR